MNQPDAAIAQAIAIMSKATIVYGILVSQSGAERPTIPPVIEMKKSLRMFDELRAARWREAPIANACAKPNAQHITMVPAPHATGLSADEQT
jgi:hypothetical protein